MNNILVRGLSNEALINLKAKAKRNKRSLAAEVREILERDSGKSRLSREEFLKIMDGIRERAGPQTSDSVDLIREDRDR